MIMPGYLLRRRYLQFINVESRSFRMIDVTLNIKEMTRILRGYGFDRFPGHMNLPLSLLTTPDVRRKCQTSRSHFILL